ncbi:MAG TPA: hypothetical protein VF295_12585 [Candidatus Limnocylindria bacterium]
MAASAERRTVAVRHRYGPDPIRSDLRGANPAQVDQQRSGIVELLGAGDEEDGRIGLGEVATPPA